MALRTEELAKTIDQTLLDPTAARGEIERHCRQADELHIGSVGVLVSACAGRIGFFCAVDLTASPALVRA